MNIEEFNRWKKRFRKDIESFRDECWKLKNLHNSVIDVALEVIDVLEELTTTGMLGKGVAWRGVNRLKSSCLKARDESWNMQNMISASVPVHVSFLSNYEPALECCNKIKSEIVKFGTELGVGDMGSFFNKYSCNQSLMQLIIYNRGSGSGEWSEFVNCTRRDFDGLFNDLNVKFINRYERYLDVLPLNKAISVCLGHKVETNYYCWDFDISFWDAYEKDKTKMGMKMKYE